MKNNENKGGSLLVRDAVSNRATHCWLSPVALKIITDKCSSEKTREAADVCISHLLSLRGEDNSFDLIMRSLIYQVLLKNKHRLGEGEVDALDREVEAYLTLAADEAEMYHLQEALTKVLINSLALFDPKTTVWMILDRADQCHPERSRIRPGRIDQQRKALLKALVHTAERTGLVLKVLLVVNNAEWRVGKHADELGQEKSDSLVMARIEESDTH